jgi:hypothetical protein
MNTITELVKEHGITTQIFDMKQDMEYLEIRELSDIVEENITKMDKIYEDCDIYNNRDEDEFEQKYERLLENTLNSISKCLNTIIKYCEIYNIDISETADYESEETNEIICLLNFCYEKEYMLYIRNEFEIIYKFTQGKYSSEYNDNDTYYDLY